MNRKSKLIEPAEANDVDTEQDDTDHEDLPKDLDDFRIRLARRLALIKQDWRHCKAPACRRARACVDARLTCQDKPQEPELSEEERAKLRHELLVALRRERQRRGVV